VKTRDVERDGPQHRLERVRGQAVHLPSTRRHWARPVVGTSCTNPQVVRPHGRVKCRAAPFGAAKPWDAERGSSSFRPTTDEPSGCSRGRRSGLDQAVYRRLPHFTLWGISA
jgi:hypothetical protein